jgi:HK97 family phage prohead protease
VPFGEVARVADPPNFEEYSEEWMPGCFDHQMTAANRIHANYEHMQGPTHVVGHGVSLRAEADGYHVTSTIHRTNAGDTTLELLNAGALPCVSLEARAVRNTRTTNGVIQRVKANLRGFAFCRQGAFAGAQVLAVRAAEEQETTFDQSLIASNIDPDVIARCRRLGLELPQRYKAHPAGTPAQTGTPETAPAEDDNNTSSEDSQT